MNVCGKELHEQCEAAGGWSIVDASGEQVQRYRRIMGNMSNGMMVQILLLSSLSSDLTGAMRTGGKEGGGEGGAGDPFRKPSRAEAKGAS